MNYQAFIEKHRKFLLIGIGITCFLILSIGLLFLLTQSNTKTEPEFLLTSSNSSQGLQEQSSTEQIYVDIKGAVKKPGMYEGTAEMRVWDAVMLAGGVKEDADTKQVNFSERISDQMVIYVPVVGEILEENEGNEQEKTTLELSKININKASETELQLLPGIGQKKAQEIIRYREENGGFKKIEDLKNISGFGEKTFEKLKEAITI